jgi:hypothetical protein
MRQLFAHNHRLPVLPTTETVYRSGFLHASPTATIETEARREFIKIYKFDAPPFAFIAVGCVK